jgi:outer membrane receptor protein involved in Fe transport
MGAARANHSVVRLRDQLGDELTGDHTFSRINPSAGLTYAVPGGVTAFGSFGVASRVPTPSELGCADPDDPCRLPNAFVADPPLEQVIARTWEGGARREGGRVAWAASLFRTENRDDIIFISSGAPTSAGHFENVGSTLRRGLELSAGATATRVGWGAAYTYLRATFDTALTLSSPNHPDAVDDEIEVVRGSSIPGVPRHQFTGDVSVRMGRAVVGATLVSQSSRFLRGDEANLLEPVDGSSVVHLSGAVGLHPRVRLVGRVSNLFDTDYATFGLLGEADEVLGDAYDDPRFLSPGAPRAAWAGVEISFP